MYCPKCGQQQISDEVRFCSRCGFKLDIVKTCLTADEEPATPIPQRQSGVNLGVILMFLGTLLTSILAMAVNTKAVGAFTILTVAFLSTLLFSRPLMKVIYKLLSLAEPPADHISARRGEFNFGATLMFIGTLIAGFATMMAPPRIEGWVFFLALITVFTLILLSSKRLMRAAQEQLTGVEGQVSEGGRSQLVPSAAGEIGSISVTVSDTRRYTTGELLSPPSVTEHTTSLFENRSDPEDPGIKGPRSSGPQSA